MRKQRFGTIRVQFTLPMIFTLIIGFITAMDIFYWQDTDVEYELWKLMVMFSCFVIMMLLDMVDMLVFPRTMPYAILVFLFFLRVGFIVFITYLDPTYYAASLAALIPYYTFFAYGGVVSVIFSTLLGVFFYTRIPQFGPDVTQIFGYLLFMQILAFMMYHAHRTALRNRYLLQEVQQTNTELELMADEIAELSAVEERVRLSRDLHDSVGHHLTAISIQLEKAVAYQAINEEDSIESIRNARNSASQALQEVRQFVSTLKEKEYKFSLKTKAESLVESMDTVTFDIDLDITGTEEPYPLNVRRSLFFALQELLTNIQKHAKATQAKIIIKFGRKETLLQVSDNGEGFNLKRALKMEGHYGLSHLQERTKAMGGSLNIETKPQKGTIIEIRVPRKGQS